MKKYIAMVEEKIKRAKSNGENHAFVSFASGTFADNRENQKRLERAFEGINFSWQEAYDDHGVAWATWLHIKW